MSIMQSVLLLVLTIVVNTSVIISNSTLKPKMISIPLTKRQPTMNSPTRRLTDATSIKLTNYYNNEYVGTIGVGTPPQYLTVIFDTGSSDIWFPSRLCTTCAKHKYFDNTISSTYKSIIQYGNIAKTFTITYGSGKVTGNVATETMTLDTLTLHDMTIGEVTAEDTAIANFDMDGLCGLAFPALAVISKPSFINVVYTSNPTLSKSFSLYLNSNPNHDDIRPSMLTFGGYDLSYVGSAATLFYTPVVRYGSSVTYWTVEMTSFEISVPPYLAVKEGDIAMSLCDYGYPCLAIIDSGTSGLAIPDEYYTSILLLVTSGLDCKGLQCVGTSLSSFPTLYIHLAPDNVFPLLASDYVECSVYGRCDIKFQTSSKFWILGDVFLQAYYTHFDVENLRIGFACNGTCSGGTWQGTGGYYVDTTILSPWKAGILIFSLFIILLSPMLSAINYAYDLYGDKLSEGDDDSGDNCENEEKIGLLYGSDMGVPCHIIDDGIGMHSGAMHTAAGDSNSYQYIHTALSHSGDGDETEMLIDKSNYVVIPSIALNTTTNDAMHDML